MLTRCTVAPGVVKLCIVNVTSRTTLETRFVMASRKGAGRKRKLEDVIEEPPQKAAKEEEPEADAEAEDSDEVPDALNRIELVRTKLASLTRFLAI